MNKSILPPQQRFLAFAGLCLGIMFTSLFGAIWWGPIWGLILPLPLLIIAFILRWVFFPRFSGRTRVQLASLTALCLPATLYIPSNPITLFLVEWLSRVLQLETNLEVVWVVIGTHAFITLGVILLNQIWSRVDVSQPQENPEDSETLQAANQDYAKSLDRYCTPLIRFLDRYDDDVNWSDRDLTPLEAEVETEQSGRLGSRIVPDLVSAIRRDKRSEVFVVLGDPGSGKSVSLRRLVRVLCQQALRTGVVPVYINLREWVSEFGEVTSESLVEFVKEKAYSQTGRDGRAFIDTWYEPFRKSGRLFFVIDSFDELPSILDCDDKSDLHRKISAAFDQFFTQEIYSCRAVLASRNFRAPVGLKGTRLVIQPFKETQIRRAMKQWLVGKGIDTNKYVKDLFRDRPQLVPLLRNPFTAELIAEYARSGHGNRLPDSMFAVFDHYIATRLDGDRSTFRRYGTSPEQVRSAASVIAKKMYEDNDTGLEVDVSRIDSYLNCPESSAIIEALKYSRIARVGGDSQRRFSFVHRRFTEFFVVSAFHEEDLTANLDSIPTDSRWRDCLVMYCGIASLSERQKVIDFCWKKISKYRQDFAHGDINKSRPAIHCLRFLNDACRGDTKAIQNIQNELEVFILNLFEEPNVRIGKWGERIHMDLLVTKIGVESIQLMKGEKQQIAISNSFLSNSEWIRETALGSCRHIADLSQSSHVQIREYIRAIPSLEKIKRINELDFLFSTSDIFRVQRRSVWIDVFYSIFFYLYLFGLLIYNFLVSIHYTILFLAGVLTLIPIFYIFLFEDVGKSYKTIFESAISRLEFRFVIFSSLALLPLFSESKIPFWMWEPIWGILNKVPLPRFFVEMPLMSQQHFLFLLIGVSLCVPWEVYVTFLGAVFRMKILEVLIALLVALLALLLSIPKGISQFKLKLKDEETQKFLKTQLFSFLGIRISVFGFVILVLIGFVLVHVLTSLFIPEEIVSLLGGILFGGMLSYFTIVMAFRRVSNLWNLFLDHRMIRQQGWPNMISCNSLYEYCLSLRTQQAARFYLNTIRKLRVPLIGEVVEPPSELILKMRLSEELGKLREQWYDLSA